MATVDSSPGWPLKDSARPGESCAASVRCLAWQSCRQAGGQSREHPSGCGRSFPQSGTPACQSSVGSAFLASTFLFCQCSGQDPSVAVACFSSAEAEDKFGKNNYKHKLMGTRLMLNLLKNKIIKMFFFSVSQFQI